MGCGASGQHRNNNLGLSRWTPNFNVHTLTNCSAHPKHCKLFLLAFVRGAEEISAHVLDMIHDFKAIDAEGN
eukprot:1039786-Amphidinium_carterae.1